MSQVRLQVILSRAGVASRRQAEAYVLEGRVAVNGTVVRTLGSRADPDVDLVTLDDERVGAQDKATIAMHKPDGVMTTMSDPEGRETVADLVEDEPLRLHPVGRLDYRTEGLLLMSTDGELMHRLLHPRHGVAKTYKVQVAGCPDDEALDVLRAGVPLEDGPTRPAIVDIVDRGERRSWLEITVTEGRNRLIRRMCDEIGHVARRVIRVAFGTIELGDLGPGEYRYLNQEELEALHQVAELERGPMLTGRAQQMQGKVMGRRLRRRGAFPGEERADPEGKKPRPTASKAPARASKASRTPKGARGAAKPSGGRAAQTSSARTDRRPTDRSSTRTDRRPAKASSARTERRPEKTSSARTERRPAKTSSARTDRRSTKASSARTDRRSPDRSSTRTDRRPAKTSSARTDRSSAKTAGGPADRRTRRSGEARDSRRQTEGRPTRARQAAGADKTTFRQGTSPRKSTARRGSGPRRSSTRGRGAGARSRPSRGGGRPRGGPRGRGGGRPRRR